MKNRMRVVKYGFKGSPANLDCWIIFMTWRLLHGLIGISINRFAVEPVLFRPRGSRCLMCEGYGHILFSILSGQPSCSSSSRVNVN